MPYNMDIVSWLYIIVTSLHPMYIVNKNYSLIHALSYDIVSPIPGFAVLVELPTCDRRTETRDDSIYRSIIALCLI